MLKHRIPMLAPLCLSLTSAAACGPTPENVAEDLCMKFVSCFPEYATEMIDGMTYEEYCVTYYTQYFEMVEMHYSSTCADAFLRFYACIADEYTCDGDIETTPCTTEYAEVTESCDFADYEDVSE